MTQNQENQREETRGTAYAFFYSSAPIAALKDELPRAREMASAPYTLELKLMEGVNPEIDDFAHDPELRYWASEALKDGNNYTMIASLPYVTNKKTASELGDIQNMLYQSPLKSTFMRNDSPFQGGIIYKEGSRYEFAE